MTNRLFYALALTLVLSGCTTDLSTNVNYYLLDNASSTSESKALAQRPIKVTIDTFELADYLQQANLSMQLEGHQIYYSKQHFWAESLQSSMLRALLNDLNKNSTTTYFQHRETKEMHKPDFTMGINITHFLPTYESYVVLVGEYQIYNMKDPDNISKSVYNFNYKLPLDKNGYGHAVEKLRMLLSSLSKEVLNNMNNLEI